MTDHDKLREQHERDLKRARYEWKKVGDERDRLREEVQRVTQHVEWLEAANVRFRKERDQLRGALKGRPTETALAAVQQSEYARTKERDQLRDENERLKGREAVWQEMEHRYAETLNSEARLREENRVLRAGLLRHAGLGYEDVLSEGSDYEKSLSEVIVPKKWLAELADERDRLRALLSAAEEVIESWGVDSDSAINQVRAERDRLREATGEGGDGTQASDDRW